MSENYIVKKILGDARLSADAVIKDAKKKAADKISAVKRQFELDEAEALKNAKNKHEKHAEHHKALAEIEVRKANLVKKHAALDEVFADARSELLKGDKYNTLIAELVKRYARKGDTVLAAKKLSTTLAQEYKLKQITDPKVEGIILSNDNYELKLTLDELLKNFRVHREEQIAKILWGG